jgi:N-acetylmuramoyl-L-alanine amidase
VPVLRPGQSGPDVAALRRALAELGLLRNTGADVDEFDAATENAVRAFQQRRGLSVDGRVGPDTSAALQSARWRLGDRVLAHNATAPLVGDDVTALQDQLIELGYRVGRPDGVFGTTTAEALRLFQRESGLLPDAVCGPVTLRALRQLGRRVVGGRPQLLREMMAVAQSGPSLLGKRIVIDPGHGGDDAGERAGWISEADLTWDLATRLEGRLTAIGVTSWLTRGPAAGPTEAERAAFANDVAADVVISLHVDRNDSPQPNGLATFHYGAGETSSSIGERLAELVQREIVARTGLLDNRTHAKSWDLLRLTRMPAVRVEVGYLSHDGDRERLMQPLFRDHVAEGILVAVQRLYLPRDADPETGVLRMPAAS